MNAAITPRAISAPKHKRLEEYPSVVLFFYDLT